jgi:TctA family transporter
VGDTVANLALGFSVALSPKILFYAFAGCLVGTLVGVLPGIGPTATVALLLCRSPSSSTRSPR